jgi:hypothetical protein
LQDDQALFIPATGYAERICTLAKRIPAILMVPTENGRAKLGKISQIPVGAQVEVFGEGYDSRTIKVRFHDGFYFVFSEDLELPKENCAPVSWRNN